MKQFALLLLIIVSACATTTAQINVGSSQAPDNSAMLQVSGTTKGFLPPRMSRTEMNAISQPAKGLIVFSTTDSALFMRRDTGWVKLLGDANFTLTGDVTNSPGSSVTTISNGAVTNAKMANMPANTFKANNTGSAAVAKDITGTQATALLDPFTSTTKGLVPASGGVANTFLRSDGTFQPISGGSGGTVTSVSVTNVNGVSGTVANATTTPAISLTLGNITPTSVTTTSDITSGGLVWVDRANVNNGILKPGLLFGDAGTGEGIASKRTAGGNAFGLDFYTSFNNRMSITQGGNIGIGVSTPAYKLHVVSSGDPLYLGGVNTGTSTSADSLLTITSGVIKKIPVSTFTASGNTWSISGNSGTVPGTHFLGTIDYKSLAFRTNNTQRMLLDENGNVAVGTGATFSASPEKFLVDAGATQSFNVISGKGNINNYLQLNIQNRNAGGSASSDVVATADNGDEANNYVDMGINSSGNTANYFGGANDAYLYNIGQNFLIGTGSAGKSMVFMTGGSTQSSNERMRIDGSGNVGIGVSAPTAKLHVVGTNPLTLLGVQPGTNTSTDSVLTITSGVVKKLPASAFLSSSGSGYWSLSGNNNTLATNSFLGTTNADPLIFKINSQPAGRLDATNTFFGSYAGYNNGNNASQTTGIGYHAAFSNTSGLNNTALGYNSLPNNATGSYNIGIGYNADVVNNSSNSILIGSNTVANNSYSIAMGTSAQTNNTNAISIGNNTYTNGNYGISIGSGLINGSPKTQAFGDYSMALGYNAYAGGANSVSIGSGTNSGGTNTISIGNNAAGIGLNSVAIGYNSAAIQDNTIVLGDKSNSNLSVAIGPESFSAGNREKLLVDAGTSTSFNVISAKGSLNNYLQMNVQNRFGGSAASSDLVATADNGDENNNYVDLGINSSVNSSNSWGGPNDAYLYAQSQNMLIGTASASKSIAFLTGGGNQSSNERMRIDGNGNVGIGTTAPSARLHVVPLGGSAQNPLALSGVPTGSPADSVLTIINTVVRKVPLSSYTNTLWSITGNSNTPSGTAFLGTTNNAGVKFRTNNTQLMLLDSLGNVAIGSSPAQTSGTNTEKLLVDAGNTNSINVISGKGSLNNYLQLNIQNRNNGSNASSDVVATADNGDESNNYVDLGINSSGNTANYFGSANDAYLYAQSQNMLVGTATANKSVVFLTGGGNQNNNERMRIDGSGNVGIGITAPTSKLHVSGINPLTLNGVQTGTNTSADSLLTITNGLVRKLPVSTLATSGNDWSTTGNSGTTAATNFLGTTDLKSLKFRTNNVSRMVLDSTGNVVVGTEGFDGTNPEKFLINAGNTTSVNGLVTKGAIDNYFQMNIKNGSSGANATTDIVATADNGNETTNYVDLGINGSGYTGSAIQTGVANDGYLISSGNDFYMVNSSSNKNMLFLTGGTGVANERMRILANGRVGMGVQDPSAPFVVKDTMEIRRIGSLSQLLFTKTAGSGDFRIGGDGGDIFWQGGGGRALQMGSFWTTVLSGDRQNSNYPSFVSGLSGTGVLVPSQRDGSVALGVQANSTSQTANLTEWRNSAGTTLSAVTKDGSLGVGTTTFSSTNPEKFLADAGASGGTSYQNVVVGKGNTNSYAQLNIQNSNTGNAASSDVVATADNGNESNNYIDMGINGSGNTSNNFGDANDAYLYNVGQDMLIGTATANKTLAFLTGGTSQATNERMRIDGSGNVGIGTTSLTSTLSIGGSVSLPVKKNTASYSLTATDYVVFNTGGAVTYTLPDPVTCTGRVYKIINHGTGNVTFSRNITTSSSTSGTVLGSSAGTNSIEIISDGSIWRRLDQ